MIYTWANIINKEKGLSVRAKLNALGNTVSQLAIQNASLGTLSIQNASAVAITGGTITGITPLSTAFGGTGSGTVSGARNNLSVYSKNEIDNAFSLLTINRPSLLAIGALDPVSNTFPYYTSANSAALAPITAQGRSFLTQTTAAAQATAIGLGNVTNKSETQLATSGPIKAALDTKVENILDYTALRAYAGSSRTFYLYGAASFAQTPDGTQGDFYIDDYDTTSPDNGGTIFVITSGPNTGKRVKRFIEDIWEASWFKLRPTNTAAQNDAAIAAIFAAASPLGEMVWVAPSETVYQFSAMISTDKPVHFYSDAAAAINGNASLFTPCVWKYVGSGTVHSFVWFHNGGANVQKASGSLTNITIECNDKVYNAVRCTDVQRTTIEGCTILYPVYCGILVDNLYSTDAPAGYSRFENNRIVTINAAWSARANCIHLRGRTNAETEASGLHRFKIDYNLIQVNHGVSFAADNGDGYTWGPHNNIYVYGNGFGPLLRGWSRFRFDGALAWDAANGIPTAGTIWEPDLYDNATLFGTAGANVKPENYTAPWAGTTEYQGNAYPVIDPAIAGTLDQSIVGYYGTTTNRQFYVPYNFAERGCSIYVRAHPNGDGQSSQPAGPGAASVQLETISGLYLREMGWAPGNQPINSELMARATWRSRAIIRFRNRRTDVESGYNPSDWSLYGAANGAFTAYDGTQGKQAFQVLREGGVQVMDSSYSYQWRVQSDAFTADRTLLFKMGDANRTFDLTNGTDFAHIIEPSGLVQDSAGAATANALAIIAAFQRIPSGKRAVVQIPKHLTGVIYLDRNINEQSGYGAVTFDQGSVSFSGGGIFPTCKLSQKIEGVVVKEALYTGAPGSNDTHHQYEAVEVASDGAAYGRRFTYAKTGLAGSGFDVADSVQGYWLKTSNNASVYGVGLNRWDICTIAPQASTNFPYAVNYEEINPINLHGNLNATLGLDREAQTQGMGTTLVVAENRDFSGRHPGALAYPVYYAFATSRAGLPGGDGKYTSIYYPFIAYQDSVTAGGVAFTSMGGTNINADGQYPKAHFMGRNTATYGLDFSDTTVTSGAAIRLKANHSITWDDNASIQGNAGVIAINKDLYFTVLSGGITGPNSVGVALNSGTDQAITFVKPRSSTVWKRYAFADVGGFDSDSAGAQFRGYAFIGPGYTDGGTQYGAFYQYFRYDTSAGTVGFKKFVFDVNNSHTFEWAVDGATKFRVSSSELTTLATLAPDANATRDIGTSALRYNNIYLANNPNVSSDIRTKYDIKPVAPTFALKMLEAIEPKTFKLLVGGASFENIETEDSVIVPAQTEEINHPEVYEETWIPPVLNVTTTPRIDKETGEQAFKDEPYTDENGEVKVNRILLRDTHTEIVEQAKTARGKLVSEAWTETVEVKPERTDVVKKIIEVATPKTGSRDHVGFIAQDVKAFLDAEGVDLALWGLADASDPDSKQQLRYEQFIAVLWAANKELLARIEKLENQ